MAAPKKGRETLLKELKPGQFRKCAGLLNIDSKWQDLAASLTKKDGSEKYEYYQIK